MEHDDRYVSIGGSYDDVVGVSNIIYGLGLEADAGVCFGVVVIQYANGLLCLTTPSSTKKCRHSPRWPTYAWRSCMTCRGRRGKLAMLSRY